MDFQNRVGSRTGGGGVAGWSESNRDRRERLRKLALETIDLARVSLPRALIRIIVHVFSNKRQSSLAVSSHQQTEV